MAHAQASRRAGAAFAGSTLARALPPSTRSSAVLPSGGPLWPPRWMTRLRRLQRETWLRMGGRQTLKCGVRRAAGTACCAGRCAQGSGTTFACAIRLSTARRRRRSRAPTHTQPRLQGKGLRARQANWCAPAGRRASSRASCASPPTLRSRWSGSPPSSGARPPSSPSPPASALSALPLHHARGLSPLRRRSLAEREAEWRRTSTASRPSGPAWPAFAGRSSLRGSSRAGCSLGHLRRQLVSARLPRLQCKLVNGLHLRNAPSRTNCSSSSTRTSSTSSSSTRHSSTSTSRPSCGVTWAWGLQSPSAASEWRRGTTPARRPQRALQRTRLARPTWGCATSHERAQAQALHS
mmetsp:Transcript_24734/g.67285  ORF Transcript_24734/g.67285 Transcript_24734/m.67285 type:complete len:351 (-) Transcript_24734:966-2018(-)